MKVNVIGAGLAGSEAAWQLAQARRARSRLYEMQAAEVHRLRTTCPALPSWSAPTPCASDRLENAVGLLKEEMRRVGSLDYGAARTPRACPRAARWPLTAQTFSAA